MKNLHTTFAKGTFLAALAAIFSINAVSAQDSADQQQLPQGAQTTYTENIQQLATDEAVLPEATVSKSEKNTLRIVAPQNATPKQARQIARTNKMLEKIAQSPDSQQPSGLKKVAAGVAMKKLSRNLSKLNVEETKEVRAIKEASAAQANKNVTLGIVLAAVGLLFSLLFGGILGILGVVLLIVGVVLLILGLVE